MRTDFSSSKLVRMLGAWAEPQGATAPAPAAEMDFSERLGLWVNAFDAIGLQSAQQTIRSMRGPAAGQRPAARGASLAQDVARARAALLHAIAQPVPDLHDPAAGYARYQHRHHELQRMMDQMLRPLRDHARQALAGASCELRQLAALDAVLENLLAAREQALWPRVASLLARRWQQAQADDAPPDAGLAAFEHDWRQALQAELDLRLDPVMGLVDALAASTPPLSNDQA